jgi:hypothetical protein
MIGLPEWGNLLFGGLPYKEEQFLARRPGKALLALYSEAAGRWFARNQGTNKCASYRY